MKKVVYMLIFFIFFFVFASNIFAKTYNVRIVDITGWADLHSEPYGWSWYSNTYHAGDILELVDTYKHNGNWYKVKDPNTGQTGYISSNYAIPYVNYQTGTNNATTSCEIEMQNAGFPSSYWPYLCFMKEQHSNWQFTAINTGLNWSSAVQAESSCGTSYIIAKSEDQKDNTCYNQYSHTWYPASKLAVSYYMDPRNFLGENFIFQFEYLRYDNALANQYSTVVSSILSGAAFYNYHTSIGTNFAADLNTAGKNTNVSPTFLAARIIQELGSGDSLYNLYSGHYPGYEGYYNFYNYGVSDSCATTSGTTACGLESAKKYGWHGLIAALEGGARFISDSYIAVGQYTTYLQKFNVKPDNPNSLYVHQYMTNIQAPMSEAKTIYADLRDTNFLNNTYSFHIPVYNNMDTIIDNTGSGATGEDPDNEPSTLPVSTIVTNSGYQYTSTTLSKVNIGSSINDLIGSLEGSAGHGNVRVTDKNDNIITDGTIKTGDKVTIVTEGKTEILEIVVYGDTSGDGKVSIIDLLQVQKQILGTYNLNGVYNSAGDTSKDGKITIVDLLQVQKQILGTYNIIQ